MITVEAIIVAAGTLQSGKEIIKLLLDRCWKRIRDSCWATPKQRRHEPRIGGKYGTDSARVDKRAWAYACSAYFKGSQRFHEAQASE
jgi:hypothetical protein